MAYQQRRVAQLDPNRVGRNTQQQQQQLLPQHGPSQGARGRSLANLAAPPQNLARVAAASSHLAQASQNRLGLGSAASNSQYGGGTLLSAGGKRSNLQGRHQIGTASSAFSFNPSSASGTSNKDQNHLQLAGTNGGAPQRRLAQAAQTQGSFGRSTAKKEKSAQGVGPSSSSLMTLFAPRIETQQAGSASSNNSVHGLLGGGSSLPPTLPTNAGPILGQEATSRLPPSTNQEQEVLLLYQDLNSIITETREDQAKAMRRLEAQLSTYTEKRREFVSEWNQLLTAAHRVRRRQTVFKADPQETPSDNDEWD